MTSAWIYWRPKVGKPELLGIVSGNTPGLSIYIYDEFEWKKQYFGSTCCLRECLQTVGRIERDDWTAFAFANCQNEPFDLYYYNVASNGIVENYPRMSNIIFTMLQQIYRRFVFVVFVIIWMVCSIDCLQLSHLWECCKRKRFINLNCFFGSRI